jgi:hypothetical protein
VDEKRVERLQVMLAAEELKALDDWRFASRMPTRAAAVRELLKRGLAAEGFAVAGPESKSSDFGVTDEASRQRRETGGPVRRSRTRTA